jgi:hypothetical protein
VRFQEHVQVIAPSLRSTLESREAGTSSRACIWRRSSSMRTIQPDVFSLSQSSISTRMSSTMTESRKQT